MPGEETIRIIDLPANKADIAELISEIRKLDEAMKGISGISIFGKTGNAAEARQQQTQMAAGMEQIAELQRKMIDLENQLAEARKKSTGTGGGKAKTDEEIRARIEESEAAKKQYAAIRDKIKWDEAEVDSMVRKRIELKQIKAEYIKLSPEKQAMESGQAMVKQMKELSDELLRLESGYGQFGRNVGNYSGALKVLEEEFKKVSAAMSQMETKTASTFKNMSAAAPVGFNAGQWKNQNTTALTGTGGVPVSVLNEDAEAYAKLSQQAGYLNTIIQKNEMGFSSVTQQIRSNEKALQSLRAAGLEGTEAFAALREETTASAREMKEFQRQQKLLESELPGLKALTLAAKGLGGAYAIGAGAANLFADGNEKVEKEMNKMIAIMTILQGLGEAWEFVQQAGAEKTVLMEGATKALSAATGIYEFVVEGATAAQIALNAALVAGGIGAIVLLIYGLVEAYKQSASAIEEDLEKQKQLNDAIKGYNEQLVKASENLEDALNYQKIDLEDKIKIKEILALTIDDQLELNRMKLQAAQIGKTNAEQELKDMDLTISGVDLLQDRYRQLGDQLTALNKAKIEFTNSSNKEGFLDRATSWLAPLTGNSKMLASDFLEVTNKAIETTEAEAEAMKAKLDRGRELVKQINDNTQAIDEQNAEDQKFAHELYERKIAALHEISQILREQSAEYLRIQQGEGRGTQTQQLLAMQAEHSIRSQMILSNMDQELRAEGLTKDERRLIREKANQQMIELDTQFIGQEAQIRYNARNQEINDEVMTQAELLKMREKFYQQQEDQANNAAANRKAYLDSQRDGELKALIETHAKSNPTGKDQTELRKYNDAKLRIETEYNNRILESDEELNRKQIALNNAKIRDLQASSPGTDDQKRKQQKDIDDLNRQNNTLAAKNSNIEFQIAQNSSNFKNKLAIEDFEHKQKLSDAEIDLAKQTANSVAAFVDGAYEHQIQLMDRQIQKNNELKETESARIANSTLSETQKAATMTRLALETDQKNQALERRKRQMQVREAEFDRDKGILDVGINTAMAIMKAVSDSPETGGLPFSAIAAAMGAAEIAAILARPIPKYEIGTDFSPEGIAVVHPGEMRIDPSGKISMTPDQPAMTYLERGTKIIPRHKHDEMNDILLASIFNDSKPVQDNRLYHALRGVEESNARMSRDIVAAIKKQKPSETHVHVDSNFLTYIKTCL